MRPFHLAFPLLALLCLSGQTAHAGIAATATFTDTQAGPEYSYDITLNNTGTTTIGTFWFAWVPGSNFMPVSPTNITEPAGWTETITPGGGYAIQWVTSSSLLASGGTLPGFEFQSTMTPAQLEGPYSGSPPDTVATSFVYHAGPFSDSGDEFVVLAAPQSVPEPSTIMLVGLGFVGLFFSVRKRVRSTSRLIPVVV